MQRRNFIKTGASCSVVCLTTVNAFSRMLDVWSNSPDGSNPAYSAKSFAGKLTTQSAIVKCNGADVRIHAIQTGWCAVKESHRTNHAPHFLTPLKITFDRHFTEFIPIWVWVIEHPEGVIVIDTGENSRVMNLNYFEPAGKIVSAYNRKNIKFQVAPEDEIGNQLKQLNIHPDGVRCVVLTHLHLDHTDGLHDFPETEIIVSRDEFEHPAGNIPQLYPSWFSPTLVSYRNDFITIFNKAYPITKKEDLLLIPTNGHTPHHASVLFRTDDFDILFAGDVSYTQRQLLDNDLPGINTDYRKSLATYQNIRKYAETNKLIYLPSHDAGSASRLTERIFL